ncbi:lysis protein [Moellerella wisconsensis]|uniref:lysis system i-spanin subunit Rz n=1 Tax=Moellerella wisconsensis TaxID=158849 RepID=UPI001F4DD1FA|nr:lysis system i-spanin subunit Rz [Moellerella wisconsensis]UNH25934.1 lysis protein [Moellerella wisconsensis]
MVNYRHVLGGYLVVAFIAALVSGGAVFSIARLDFKTKLSVSELGHQMALSAISAQAFIDANEKLAQLKKAQESLHQLDVAYNQRLLDEQNKSQRLRDDLLTERRRVRFASADLATCEFTINHTARAGSVGDGTTVGLTRKGGLIVHDIRTGIKQDRAKISYLQGYIRDVVDQCKGTK